MGWADCGTDSRGRPIGYAFEATCDEPGCAEKIDRGLGYACGGMHGELEIGCEDYFCSQHLEALVEQQGPQQLVEICRACAERLMQSGEWYAGPEDGVIYPLCEGKLT